MTLALALLLCLQDKPKDEKKEEPWTFTLGASYVFADALIRDPFNEPLASELLNRKDSGLALQAVITHQFFKIGPVLGELGLDVHQSSWFKNEDFDVTLINPTLSITAVEKPVVFTQVVGAKYAAVGGDPFAQSLYSVTGLGVAPLPVVFSYAFSARDYQVRAPSAAEDRDGVQHTFLALGTVSEKPISFKLGLHASWITTDGSDFDRTEWGPLAILEYDLFWKTQWRADLRWTTSRYLHANSLAPVPTKRSDGSADLKLSVRKTLADELSAVIGLEFRNYGSNIALFDYDRLLLQLGLELKF